MSGERSRRRLLRDEPRLAFGLRGDWLVSLDLIDPRDWLDLPDLLDPRPLDLLDV
jgi:hypothetical protein